MIKPRNISQCLIGYLHEVIKPLVLIIPKMSWYIKTVKEKNNKLTSFRMDNVKLLEKYKTIWTKIEDLKILNWMLYFFMVIDI